MGFPLIRSKMLLQVIFDKGRHAPTLAWPAWPRADRQDRDLWPKFRGNRRSGSIEFSTRGSPFADIEFPYQGKGAGAVGQRARSAQPIQLSLRNATLSPPFCV
jgi:hypothetical protein